MAKEVAEVEVEDQVTDIPEDYAAFTKFRDDAEETAAPDEEEEAPSESADEAGQTAEDSDSEDEEQQEDEPQEPEKGTRISRRMRKLTGEIAELKTRLAERETLEAEDDVEGEVASPAEEVADQSTKLVRPALKDFEDTDEESAWDQYEAAMEAYNDARTERQLETALAKQRTQLELEHAKDSASAEWSKQASRFPDYNQVVREEVKISAAMESVMRMDPESGTALAYYMGQHPEESERIAKATLATNADEWGIALARAGMELGTIRAKLTPPGKSTAGKVPLKAAAGNQPKIVTSASKPPTQIRGGVAVPKTDVMDEDAAGDYRKWNRAREAQLKRK